MSGLIHKVKDALTGHDTTHDNKSTTHPSDTTHHVGNTGTGSTTTDTYGSNTAGPHRSDMANKADPRVDSDRDGRSGMTGGLTGKSTGVGGYGSHTTSGPHGSDAANKLDPRVDSDRDGSRTTGGGYSGAGVLGSSGTHGTHNTHHTAGPHSSDAANKIDPRVDSDRDGRGAYGTTGTSGLGTSGLGTSGLGTSGLGSSHHTTAGPHSSDAANKLDPRVDSDRDGRTGFSSGSGPLGGTTGIHSHRDTYGTHETHPNTHSTNPVVLNAGGVSSGLGTSGLGTSGLGTSHHTTAGPHSSDAANKLDPRVDSDRDGRSGLGDENDRLAHNQFGHMETLHTKGSSAATSRADPRFDSSDRSHHTTSGTHGAGPAPNTAGPHKSDLLNKLDPRVDSNLDGSKTAGGNKTFDSTGTSHTTGNTHHTTGTTGTTGTSGITSGTHHHGPSENRMFQQDYTKDINDASQVPPSQFQREYGSGTQGSKQGGAL